MDKSNDSELRRKWEAHRSNIVKTFRNWPNAPERWTVPFIPWCGGDYESAQPRILFAGKSVGAFNDPDAVDWTTSILSWAELPDVRKLTDRYMTEKVAKFQASNPDFWLIPFLLAGALLPDSTDSSRIAHSFSWTNIYKVNNRETKGIPCDADLRCVCPSGSLIHMCAEWFKKELQILKPELVLMGVGPEESKKFAKELGIAVADAQGLPTLLDGSAVDRLELGYTPTGIWVTNHFTAWGRSSKHGTMILEIRRP